MLLKQGGYTKLFYYFHLSLFHLQRGVDWLISSIEPSESPPPSPPFIIKTTSRSLEVEKETTKMAQNLTLNSLFNL